MDFAIILQAVILGIVEGLTEFIPVSSTGHLILLIDILQFQAPPGKTLEIIIQLGSILAVCWLYRSKLVNVLLGLPSVRTSQKFAINILLAFMPAAIMGAVFHDFIKQVLFSPVVVSISLVIGGIIILIIEKLPLKQKFNNIDQLNFKTSLMIGFAQCLAMIPGTSRSGATIMSSLCLGLDRKTATEFSFFLAIPTMFGATIYDIYKNIDILSARDSIVIGVAFICAFISALLVVKHVVAFVSKNGFAVFAYYRILLGSLMLALLYIF
jgi:undecaprenyl-diphosphatase